VRILEVHEAELSRFTTPSQTVVIGADHGGFRLKEVLKPVIESLGLTVKDIGVFDEKPADYPDIAHKVAQTVVEGTATRGIAIDGAGIGSSMAANKVPAFARPYAMIGLPLEIAANTMILMYLHWVDGC